MSTRLNTHRRPAEDGQADSLVVLLHGYGADGKDLIGLAEMWARNLGSTAFVAPDAPQPCDINPTGRQWFPISGMESPDRMDTIHTIVQSIATLQQFIDKEISAAGIPDDRVIVVGFSQGTMMALHAVPRREMQLAGVVGFSGKLLFPGLLESECRTRPPMVLVHGEADEIVPSASSTEAAVILERNGIPVQSILVPELGHGIDHLGIGIALHFMKARLAAPMDKSSGVACASQSGD